MGRLGGIALAAGILGSTKAACSPTADAASCAASFEAELIKGTQIASPPSLVKCLGATLAGSAFALLCMLLEGRRKSQVCRKELLPPHLMTKVEPACKEACGSPTALSEATTASRCDRPSLAGSPAASATGSEAFRLSSPRSPASPAPRWKAGQLSEEDKVERQIKSILNKLTRERFDTLYEQLLACCSGSGFRSQVIEVIAREVFKKATTQHSFVELYADLCARLEMDLKIAGAEVNFRRMILSECEQSFTTHLEPPRIAEALDYEEQYEELVKHKTRMLGNVRLMGHLLRRRMLAAKIIFHCTEELLSIGSSEALETLCTFLETLGSTFDLPAWPGYGRLQEVFERLEILSEAPEQSARTRCLVKDLLDKRQNRWGAPALPAAKVEAPKQLPSKALRSPAAFSGAAHGEATLPWMEERLAKGKALMAR